MYDLLGPAKVHAPQLTLSWLDVHLFLQLLVEYLQAVADDAKLPSENALRLAQLLFTLIELVNNFFKLLDVLALRLDYLYRLEVLYIRLRLLLHGLRYR